VLKVILIKPGVNANTFGVKLSVQSSDTGGSKFLNC